MASSIFQAMGKGVTSLILTFIREVVFICVFAYLFSLVFNFGPEGVWWGLVVGGFFGCVFAYFWAWNYIATLKKNYFPDSI